MSNNQAEYSASNRRETIVDSTPDYVSSPGSSVSSSSLEAASRMHARNRRRASHFNTPVMADSTLDVMLTVMIAYEQHVPIRQNAIALANRLPPENCETLLEALTRAGLLSPKGPEGTVQLTAKGIAQMQEYLRNFG
ncbi:MAG: hypothetical protein ABI395_02870 [Sphingobium sp.]